MIDDLSKGLLALEFKSDHSIKWKCLKWIAKKLLPDYKEWKTHNHKKKNDKDLKRVPNNVLSRMQKLHS